MIYIYIVVLEPLMLHAKFVEIGLEKKIFEGFLPYKGMAAILVMLPGFLIYTLPPSSY